MNQCETIKYLCDCNQDGKHRLDHALREGRRNMKETRVNNDETCVYCGHYVFIMPPIDKYTTSNFYLEPMEF